MVLRTVDIYVCMLRVAGRGFSPASTKTASDRGGIRTGRATGRNDLMKRSEAHRLY
jgi:hypothetical protein